MTKEAHKILETYRKNNVFSACALAGLRYSKEENCFFNMYCGYVDVNTCTMKVDESTFFDIASLTKPLVTVLSILALIRENKIDLNGDIGELLPFPMSDTKKKITVQQLLTHYSGLPAHKSYCSVLRETKKNERKEKLIHLLLEEKLNSKPGHRYVYSDLDYMLLSALIEQVSGLELHQYWKEKITEPLGISHYFYTFNEEEKGNDKKFAVTGICPWTHSRLDGAVNDDNCRAFGRMLGHAGLFATLEGVTSLCLKILFYSLEVEYNPSINTEDLLYLLKRRSARRWAYGFDIPTGVFPSSGKYFSQRSIGHLGYTGTSFWIDLLEKRIVILLTNRTVYGDDASQIKELRPRIHDSVWQHLTTE